MTSSLVGSEMCIRDRMLLRPGSDVAATRWLPGWPASWLAGWVGGWLGGCCLLYTSDAADDM
eukprot:8739693-Prorocentrum_lima.AAC.1